MSKRSPFGHIFQIPILLALVGLVTVYVLCLAASPGCED